MLNDEIKHAYAAGLQRCHRELNLCFMSEKTLNDLTEDFKNSLTGIEDMPWNLMGCDIVKAGLKDGEFLFMYLNPVEKHLIFPVPEKEKM